MAKLGSKQIIEDIKREQSQRSNKKNYTFRLSEELMADFQDLCEKQGIAQGRVVENLISGFIKGLI